MTDGGLISLTAVKVTPDLLEARVYLSVFQVKDLPAAVKKFEDRAWQIKGELREEWMRSNVVGVDYNATVALLGLRWQP